MYVTIFKRQISTSLIAIALMLFTLLLTVFFIIIFKVEDKTISIINFYEQPIYLTIKGAPYTIQPFDTLVTQINTSNAFEIKVEDANQQQLQDIRIENIKRSAQMVSLALSPTTGYCFFSTKLDTDPAGNIIVKDKVILNDTPSNYSLSDLNIAFSDYSYPGKTQQVDDSKYTRTITYIYPISCNLANNDESVLNTVAAFSNYNAADQLQYLQQIREKVQQSNDINTLNSSVPSVTNKYYISDNNYVLIYE